MSKEVINQLPVRWINVSLGEITPPENGKNI